MKKSKYLLRLAIVPVLLLCICVGCEDDNPKDFPTLPSYGSGSDEYKIDSIYSEASALNGQEERSSGNFSTKNIGTGTHIYWRLPNDEISVDIKIDKTAAKDPFYANGIKNGSITPYAKEDKMYIANPNDADGPFWIYFTAFTPKNDALYIWTAKDKLSGQDHRASTNFRFGKYTLYRVECPEGVSFNINKDVSGGKDGVRHTNLTNGMIIHKTRDENLYIADVSDADGPFMVGLIPVVYPWMASLSDDLPLTSLSIPGTHDSGTMDANTAYSICQHFSIQDQLYAGMRFFDIRLDSDLDVVHGPFTGTSYDFSGVLDEMNTFLDTYPKETILMRVKEEKGSISDSIGSYFSYNSGKVGKIIRDSVLGTLGSSRGKIVLLRDFPIPDSATTWGVYLTKGWPSDSVNKYENEDGAKLYVEDRYFSSSETEHDTEEKIGLVKQAIKDANGDKYRDHLFLIFNSIAMRLVTSPWDYAWGGNTAKTPMNPALSDFLKDSVETKEKPFRTGVVILDFYNRNGYDDEAWLTERIINLNFDEALIPVPEIPTFNEDK